MTVETDQFINKSNIFLRTFNSGNTKLEYVYLKFNLDIRVIKKTKYNLFPEVNIFQKQ